MCEHYPILILFGRLGTLHNARMIQQQWNGDKPLSIFQHGLAGLAGGITVSFFATPVEQIKARLQVQYDAKSQTYSGPIDCIRKVVIHLKGRSTCIDPVCLTVFL